MIELGRDLIKDDDNDSRNIYITQDISQDTVDDAIERIIEFNQEDDIGDKEKKNFKRNQINLYISSYGGSVYCGMGLVDLILSSRTPVHTHCIGKAMSMGLAIYLSGHKKYMYKYSTLMYHSISSFSRGKLQEMEEDLEETKRLQKVYDDLVTSNSKIKKSKLRRIVKEKRDWYISSEEAVELGACDGVL